MNYADRVRAAASPQQALLVVAEGIDAILAQAPAAAPADPWGEWSPLADVMPAIERGQRANVPLRVADNAEAIEAVRDALATETDGEERLALEARLRLLTDTGQAIDVMPAAGNREQVDEQEGVVTIPPPTPERQATRIAWAMAHDLAAFSTLEAEDFYPAYGKGGPMWMYAGNRDGVMQMPVHLRRALIDDVMQDSDAAAQEMGRDILKDLTPGNSAPITDALQS